VTICEEIAEWATALRLDDVPADARERARLQAASVWAARAAGEEAAAPFAVAAPDGPAGEVYRSAVASIAHDWDDYLFMGHTGHSAVPAAAAFCDGDAERALVAQIAADEVAGRLGAALFLGPHNGQFWASIHCASAALAAALGLGLDAGRTAHALAIALYQPPYGMWPGFMGPGSKLLTAAEPAAAGVRAALLAAAGMSGALDVIEHPRGVLAGLSFAPQPGMLGGLGRVWLTETLAFKRLPGCAYLQAAAEAACSVEVDSDDIAAVEVNGGWLTCGMEALGGRHSRSPDDGGRGYSVPSGTGVDFGGIRARTGVNRIVASGGNQGHGDLGPGSSLSPVQVNFSAALSVSIALLAGRLTPAELSPVWLAENESRIHSLAARVRVRHDPAMTASTLRGTLDAGAAPDLSPRDWLRLRRRIAEAGMEGVNPGPALLRALATDRRVRASLLRSLRRSGRSAGEAAPSSDSHPSSSASSRDRMAGARRGGIDRLDTAQLRMTFPCRLRIVFRDGTAREIDGDEPGSCGHPLEEQRAVVEEKLRVAGLPATR
jgi:2-methylcitrate dehydratase PrpD